MRKIITGIFKLVLAAVSLFFVLTLAPGNQPLAAQDGFWQARVGNAAAGRIYQLNRAAMGDVLSRATLETAEVFSASPAVVSLPMADGRLARFRVQESPLFAPELAARFPQIKSYRGQSLDDPAATVRLGWSPRGLHALILGSETSVSIAPQDAQNPDVYQVSTGVRQDWQCDVREEQAALAGLGPIAERNLSVGGSLRVFRLAVATTQEFTNNAQLGGGSVAGAVAAINAYLNAVNAIYERELSVRLTLVSNTQIIRTVEPDGFTNDNRNTLLNEVAGVLANEVGSANYDVGHVFASGGIGGIASQGSVCNNTIGAGEAGPRKGRGVSSFSGPPVGGLGVLVHELGHQFGASHSYNGTVGTSCGPQRSPGTAWESGSGSTIMSYNGLCVSGGNTDNIGFAEESRFHNGSFTQIVNFLAGVACGTTQATGNAPPNVNGGPDYTIPRQTPFVLTATGGDPNAVDAAALTYNWEQIDTGGANFAQNGTAASYSDAADPAATTRPLFRPHPYLASPSRTFPSLNFILNNANTPPAMSNGFWTAESLPSVTRALNFRVTLRDNRGGGGGVSDDHVTVNVNGASGPFQITAPNTAVTWAAGSAQTVTWNVANTNAAPISCANVRITLSTDGGQTFPFVLSASTPNDGSQSVTLPAGIQTAQARIRVQAVGNIFFDISDVNFAINGGAGCPVVSGIAPVAGNAGTTLTLTGSGFTGVTAMRFSNNVNATINVVNDTTLMTAVPAGAVSGPLTLVKSGCPDAQTFAFLVCSSAAATLSVDDGVAESSSGSTISTFVNRLTPPTTGGLYFHPLPKPIRLLETRPGQLGCFAPATPLPGNTDTPQQAHGVCDGVTIPAVARAIVGNATTVSPQGWGFLTLFPGNAVRPLAASSNFNAGQVVNGPFTVGLAPNGVFNIFTFVTTHLVVDVLGYYSDEANDINGAGLLFNPLAKPVRLLDTRAGQVACFAPGAAIPGNTDVSQLARGTCQGESIPASALAVLGNATVVNAQGGFLTLWPGNATRPLAATSNFNAGQIVNRHFAVGLGPVSGAFNIYAQLQTNLVIDLSGYFAP